MVPLTPELLALLAGGKRLVITLSLEGADVRVETAAEPAAPRHEAGGLGDARHSPDFATVRWHDGKVYSFTKTQRRVVEQLWAASEAGCPAMDQATLLEGADSYAKRLQDLFRGYPAWGVVIVRGPGVGTYQLGTE